MKKWLMIIAFLATVPMFAAEGGAAAEGDWYQRSEEALVCARSVPIEDTSFSCVGPTCR